MFKRVSAWIVVVVLVAFAPSCKTGSSQDGGEGGIGSALINCAEKGVANSARHLIDDVNSALAERNYEARLTDLALRFTISAVTCAVRYVAGEASHNFAASGDHLERDKADRGRTWLKKHPVSP